MVRRLATLIIAVNAVAVLGVAVWFRVVDLDHIPGVNGDEAWYGVQISELLAGHPPALMTPTGLPLNPFFSGPEYLLRAAFGASFWVLRAPAVLSGVLAVVLTYVLGSRVLDRTTAAASALLLASLPIAIGYSRFGWDASQTPLFSLLAIYFACRRSRAATLLCLVLCLIIHPTNAFLIPILSVPYIVGYFSGEGGRETRRWVMHWLPAVAGGLAVALITTRSTWPPLLRITSLETWSHYLAYYGHLISGVTAYEYLAGPIPPRVLVLHDLAFWGLFLPVMVAGAAALIRKGRWDRIALLVGVMLGLVGCNLAAGPDAIRPGWERYAMFLIVPSVFAFSVALQALFVSRGESMGGGSRFGFFAVVLAVCWTLLINFHSHYFEAIRASGGRAFVAFRTAEVEPKRQAFALIQADIAHRWASDRSEVGRVLADGWWLYWPLRYLATGRKAVEVVPYETLGRDAERRRLALWSALESRAYAVAFADEEVDLAIRGAGFGDRLLRWDVADYGGRRLLSVYRLDGR